MRIGIDVSQVVYKGTGVATYIKYLIPELLKHDRENTYILFGSTLRQRDNLKSFFDQIKKFNPAVKTIILPIPSTILHYIWNILHIIPIEWFIGNIDIFWSSDWTTPPVKKARGVTTIHDLIVYRNPEQFDQRIVTAQKKRLQWAVKEYEAFFCDSEATLKDALTILKIDKKKLHVVYPGIS